MIGRLAAGVATAVVVLLFGCAGIAGAILGLDSGDTTTTSCLALIAPDTTTAPTAPVSPPGDVPAPPPPDDTVAPAGITQCLDCLQSPTAPASPSPTPGCGNTVELARAATWLTAWLGDPVPYLSSPDPATWFHGYRRDCSGYASMALGLPGPGLVVQPGFVM